MKWVNDSDGRIPIKSWCEQVEPQALQQAINLANHPVTAWHVALMPDCHVGYGMPIGGVIAAKDALIPNAVGVDIGCGVMAVESDLPHEHFADMARRRDFMQRVKLRIPCGEGRSHGAKQHWTGFEEFIDSHPAAEALWPSELDRQNLGTLGGGNHFIELQSAVAEGRIWLMVHSGSRNLGQRVATHYHNKALQINMQMKVALPHQELAYLPLESREGQAYLRDMNFALEYAHENRQRMMTVCCEELAAMVPGIKYERRVHIHHNYAALERHFGREVFIHRKGAIRAQLGEYGIIPGSMGTPSYIVRGLGSSASFCSSSHGAGRIMSRSEANRRLAEDQCNSAMRGIAFDRWSVKRSRRGRKSRAGAATVDLSEAPQAYKDIEEVLAAQMDLVEPVVKLQPVAVVKG